MTPVRTIRLTGRTAHAEEPDITTRPECCACGTRRRGVGFVKADEESGFRCDDCLTPDERARWCREPEISKGKVNTIKTEELL